MTPKFRDGKYVPTKKEKAAGVEVCAVDGIIIKMMAFRGTGVCSENCRKARDEA